MYISYDILRIKETAHQHIWNLHTDMYTPNHVRAVIQNDVLSHMDVTSSFRLNSKSIERKWNNDI